MDFAQKIEAMRDLRETTPHPAAVPSSKDRKMEHKTGHIRRAKELEFPVGPAEQAVSQRMRAVAKGRKAVLAGGAAGESPKDARISERMSAVSRGIKAPRA